MNQVRSPIIFSQTSIEIDFLLQPVESPPAGHLTTISWHLCIGFTFQTKSLRPFDCLRSTYLSLWSPGHPDRKPCCCTCVFPSGRRCTASRKARTRTSASSPANPAHMWANTHSTGTTPLLRGHLVQREKMIIHILDGCSCIGCKCKYGAEEAKGKWSFELFEHDLNFIDHGSGRSMDSLKLYFAVYIVVLNTFVYDVSLKKEAFVFDGFSDQIFFPQPKAAKQISLIHLCWQFTFGWFC